MLHNPILPTLNQDDVNQRYAGSYVDYGGQILYVRTIVAGRKPVAAVCDEDGNDVNIESFNWNLLDTKRPKAGWYTYPDKYGNTVCFYFRLTNRKQFHRGLTDDNTVIWYPYPDGQGAVNHFRNFRVALDSRPIPKLRVTSEELIALLNQPNKYFQILQRYLCATRSRFVRGGIDLHYRSEMIAQWYKEEWQMFNPNFVDEVKESIVDFNYKGLDEDKNLMDYVPEEGVNPKLKAPRNLKELLRDNAGRAAEVRMEWDRAAVPHNPVPLDRLVIDDVPREWWADPVDDNDDEPGENPL